ncbi:hypothetical protein [Asanoa siamensis]|uniref:BNR/Asp-box repeat protein n=1 Tax=Asanoa siamensis TaxID=926357 RepID=A0ABQ4D3W1_9ACTN|nr:hypothetical protein [Asanoa siamensis]GIF78224.1 hypothetical protein Asi02nite_77420 [Asanoa siamensis]
MSEVQRLYDRTAVSDLITAPPFAELESRGRRRADRTRRARLAGVAALALLIPGLLLAMPGGDARNTPITAPAASLPAWSAFDIIVQFHDTRYGVAQYPAETCGDGWFSVTRDGGRTWSDLRPHPTVPDLATGPDGSCARAAAVVAGPDTLVLATALPRPAAAAEPTVPDAPGGPVRPDAAAEQARPDAAAEQARPDAAAEPTLPDAAGQQALISHDGGQTWREYRPRVRTADAVPDGIVPRWPCDERPCKETGLGWYDPTTGDWMVLEHQPPGVHYSGVAVGFDGSIWVNGAGPDGAGDFQLAVSRDRGRTWLDRTPADDLDWFDRAGFTAYDGDTAYLFPMGHPPTDAFALLRTTDGGRTWLPAPAAGQFRDIVAVWVDRQGGLGVADLTRRQHLSSDGGATFAPVTLPVWTAWAVTGGLEGSPSDVTAAEPADFYLSEDGLTWRPVAVPYYHRP